MGKFIVTYKGINNKGGKMEFNDKHSAYRLANLLYDKNVGVIEIKEVL